VVFVHLISISRFDPEKGNPLSIRLLVAFAQEFMRAAEKRLHK
jgi:hypothetical protein